MSAKLWKYSGQALKNPCGMTPGKVRKTSAALSSRSSTRAVVHSVMGHLPVSFAVQAFSKLADQLAFGPGEPVIVDGDG